jgi:hypothetical protein
VSDPLPCYFNIQRVGAKMPFLAADLEACPAPSTMMASGGDNGKHPWGGAPGHDGHQSPSHRVRMDVATDWASLSTRWGFTPCR